MLAPLAAVAGGVFAARFADFSTPDVALGAACAALLAAFGLRRPDLHATRAGMTACLLGFALCAAWLQGLSLRPAPDRVDQVLDRAAVDWDLPLRWQGWVRSPPRDLGDADQLVLEVESITGVGPAHGGVQATVAREPGDPPLALRYGDRVEWLGRPRRLANLGNPGAFDRVGWLARRRIHLAVSVRPKAPWAPLPGRGGSRFEAWRWRLRELLRQRLRALAARAGRSGSDAEASLEAMLLGERAALRPGLRADFQRSGVYHVLVVSGLHVGLLAAAAFWLCRLVGAPRRWGAAAGLAAAVGYALLLEDSTPTGRAAWMLALYTAAALLFRQRRPLNVIAAVALGFLLFQPALLADVGFQLSFLSVGLIAGIVAPLFERTVEPWRQAFRQPWNADLDLHLDAAAAARRVRLREWLEPLERLSRLPRPWASGLLVAAARSGLAVVSMALLSSVLSLGLAGPLAWHFQQFAGGGPLANLFAAPLLAVIVPAGLLGLALDAAPLYTLAARAVEALAAVARWTVETLPLDRDVPPPPAWLVAAALAAAVGWGWALRRPRFGLLLAAAPACLAAACIVVHPFPPAIEPGKLELTAIDVGQGDALLLGLPDGSAGLVDAGGLPRYGPDPASFDIGEEVVAPYLWRRSIRRLAFLAVTHPDADHLGGAAAILRRFPVDRLWLGPVSYPAYEPLLALAKERGVPVERLSQGRTLSLGGAAFDALWPPATASPLAASNNNSLTLLVRYGSHELLLAGDLESDGEAAVAQAVRGYNGEVLKLAHHGSRTSSTSLLLQTFRPELAIASVGLGNPFGHPHAAALDRLRAAHARLYRTDLDGAVTVLSDGRRLEIRSFRRP